MEKKQVATVEEVGARLTEWRQSQQKGAAIPVELWSAATEVARADGLGRPAPLRLDYGKLKRLMMAADGIERTATPSLMELNRTRRRGSCAMRDRNGGPAREDRLAAIVTTVDRKNCFAHRAVEPWVSR